MTSVYNSFSEGLGDSCAKFAAPFIASLTSVSIVLISSLVNELFSDI